MLDDGLLESAKYFVFFIAIAAVAFGGFHLMRSTLKTQYPVMVVVSESMVPTLGVGDFIIVGSVDDFDALTAAPPPDGEIIVFKRSSSSNEYIVHRAIEKELNDDVWWFTTKGDNNWGRDPQPTPEGRVMGKVVGRLPVLGYFPLFIKTLRGFLLVAGFMALVFFADYIIPRKEGEPTGGRFPLWSLAPFLVAPAVIVVLWYLPGRHLMYELFALIAWYVGCVVAPLAFEDDDMGLMVWLYHFVLAMVPLACDIVWWTTGITPSNWWTGEGSTVPITWLLQKETAAFAQAFNRLALLLLPGCFIFFTFIAFKRRNVKLFHLLSRKMRGVSTASADF